jgi:hypothetical protein
MTPALSAHDQTTRELADLHEHFGQLLQWVKAGAGWKREAEKRQFMPVNTDVSGWCGGSAYDY